MDTVRLQAQAGRINMDAVRAALTEGAGESATLDD